MATQTPRRNSASQMMARTRPYSCPSSPLVVPCASFMSTTVSPHIISHLSCCVGSVTTVGGTQGIPEIAAPFSGGGFSNYVSLNLLSPVLCIDMEKPSLRDQTGRMRLSRITSITFPAANTKGSSTRASPSLLFSLFTDLVFHMPLSLRII